MRQNGWQIAQILILWTGTLLAIVALLYTPMEYKVANQYHGLQGYGFITGGGEIAWADLAKELGVIIVGTLAGMYLTRGPSQE